MTNDVRSCRRREVPDQLPPLRSTILPLSTASSDGAASPRGMHGTPATQPPRRSAAALPQTRHEKRPIPERRANVLDVLFGQVAGLDPGPSLGRSRDAFVLMGNLDIDGPGKALPSERKAEDRHRLATLCLGDTPVFPKRTSSCRSGCPIARDSSAQRSRRSRRGSVRRKEIDTAPRLEVRPTCRESVGTAFETTIPPMLAVVFARGCHCGQRSRRPHQYLSRRRPVGAQIPEILPARHGHSPTIGDQLGAEQHAESCGIFMPSGLMMVVRALPPINPVTAILDPSGDHAARSQTPSGSARAASRPRPRRQRAARRRFPRAQPRAPCHPATTPAHPRKAPRSPVVVAGCVEVDHEQRPYVPVVARRRDSIRRETGNLPL